jgi:hypothetical protein
MIRNHLDDEATALTGGFFAFRGGRASHDQPQNE